MAHHHTAHAGGATAMSFFGIGKKKLDEQSREEQSAETAKVQKEQASEDAPKNARLSHRRLWNSSSGGLLLREV